ncbi:hypothetical protein GCM10027402_13200 [Arthrobacter monumenti]
MKPTGKKSAATKAKTAVLLSVVALLVLSLGTVVADRTRPEPDPPSVTDMARSMARAEAKSLQSRARELAGIAAPGGMKRALANTADLLSRHAAQLAAPAPASPQSESSQLPSPVISAAASGTAESTSAPTVSGLVSALAANAKTLRLDARDVKAGMASLLATVSAQQFVLATSLAAKAGLPAPGLPPVPQSTDRADLIDCQSSGASDAKPAAALQATYTGLQRTVYAYEVATPQFDDPLFSLSRERRQQHRRALEQGEPMLEALCAQVPVAEPAYALPDEFRDDPAGGLALVEEDLAAMYADLVGLSQGDVRTWSISMLTRASLAAWQWENRA